MFTINLLYCITFYKHRFMFYLFTNDLFFRQRIFNYSVFGEVFFVFFVGGGASFFTHAPSGFWPRYATVHCYPYNPQVFETKTILYFAVYLGLFDTRSLKYTKKNY